jgi:peptidoglycan hydrolase-like protein with peptidoglycan-binding domain
MLDLETERQLFMDALSGTSSITAAIPNKTYSLITPEFSAGKEKEVQTIQKQLAKLKYDVPTSGSYGSKTVEAIKEFQRANDLPVTGDADPKTQEVLNKLANNLTAANTVEALLGFVTGVAPAVTELVGGTDTPEEEEVTVEVQETETNWPLILGAGAAGLLVLGSLAYAVTR